MRGVVSPMAGGARWGRVAGGGSGAFLCPSCSLTLILLAVWQLLRAVSVPWGTLPPFLPPFPLFFQAQFSPACLSPALSRRLQASLCPEATERSFTEEDSAPWRRKSPGDSATPEEPTHALPLPSCSRVLPGWPCPPSSIIKAAGSTDAPLTCVGAPCWTANFPPRRPGVRRGGMSMKPRAGLGSLLLSLCFSGLPLLPGKTPSMPPHPSLSKVPGPEQPALTELLGACRPCPFAGLHLTPSRWSCTPGSLQFNQACRGPGVPWKHGRLGPML